HAQGVVHRDLKPDNAIRTPAGVVKVLDFGIARIEDLSSSSLTGAGEIAGTVAYMAPEQIRGGDADFRSDLFAFGVLLYELATGSNPFGAGTRTATAARVIELTPPPLQTVMAARGPVAEALDRLVARCLRKDPAQRFKSTPELVTAVEHLSEPVDL